jgi:hypothetical protein
MINVLSLRFGLAFAPYFIESAAEFIERSAVAPRVVRQSGAGLIIRDDGDELVLRFQERESSLSPDDARHFLATVKLRADYYDVRKTSDEVVLANVGEDLIVSHPQSELWLDGATVRLLVESYGRRPGPNLESAKSGLPDWLSASVGADRLLLSDRRSGRWVLLGEDHMEQFDRRTKEKRGAGNRVRQAVPTILVKGVEVHLQSAFALATALKQFSETGAVDPFSETAPNYRLNVARTADGLLLTDPDKRVTLGPREAVKWSEIILSELSRLSAEVISRGKIRTVVAHDQGATWVLQWGDEVWVPDSAVDRLGSTDIGTSSEGDAGLVARIDDDLLVLLSPGSGDCVALAGEERAMVIRPGSAHRSRT